jgi:hypothetical protein
MKVSVLLLVVIVALMMTALLFSAADATDTTCMSDCLNGICVSEF